jgi:hypothetical protein
MKRFFILFLIFIGCQSGTEEGKSQEQSSQKKQIEGVDGFFSGKHILTLMSNITKNVEDTGYICVSDTGVEAKARFYFYQKNGFLSALLPQSIVRFSFLSEADSDTPYCKFRWNPSDNDFRENNWVNSLIYVVVCVKPNQIYRR